MQTIQTVATVSEDGTVTVPRLRSVPPGRYQIVIVVDDADPLSAKRPPLELPVHDSGPWPEGFTVRREDIYGDWGR
jgi:hypothetical protein